MREEMKELPFPYIFSTVDEVSKTIGEIFMNGFYAQDSRALLLKPSDSQYPSPVCKTRYITMDYPAVSRRVSSVAARRLHAERQVLTVLMTVMDADADGVGERHDISSDHHGPRHHVH